MTAAARTRQPRGIPTGGEFASNAHDEAKPWAEMTTDEHRGAVSRAILDVLAEHGIHDWEVRFNAARKQLGVARFDLKAITVSTLQFPAGKDATMDTAMHEAAHVIAGVEAGHGPAWKQVARRLGANPSYAASIDIPRESKSKMMKTRYGNVPVVEDVTPFEYNGVTFTIVEAGNTRFVATDPAGRRFRFDADQLHENYGDYSKMTNGRTRQVKTDYGIVEATEGKTTFTRRGTDYTVIEIANTKIIAVDAKGRKVRMSTDVLHPMDAEMTDVWERAKLRAAAKRRP